MRKCRECPDEIKKKKRNKNEKAVKLDNDI